MFLIRVFLVGLLIIPVIFAKPGGSGNKETLFDKEFRKKQQNCERNFCNYLPNSFNENCINQCISKLCYEKSFFNYGLEPGEIDLKRSKSFKDCLLLEWKKCDNPHNCTIS